MKLKSKTTGGAVSIRYCYVSFLSRDTMTHTMPRPDGNIKWIVQDSL